MRNYNRNNCVENESSDKYLILEFVILDRMIYRAQIATKNDESSVGDEYCERRKARNR